MHPVTSLASPPAPETGRDQTCRPAPLPANVTPRAAIAETVAASTFPPDNCGLEMPGRKVRPRTNLEPLIVLVRHWMRICVASANWVAPPVPVPVLLEASFQEPTNWPVASSTSRPAVWIA